MLKQESKLKYPLKTKFLMGLCALACSAMSLHASATIVQVESPLGNFEVNLYDQATPATVANFLAYVNAGDYNNSVIHRSVPGFIVQGGGFNYVQSWPLGTVNSNAAVTNEPVYSNVRGTIAMAKLSNNPNSATNQWFINLGNNSENLDRQNAGFTVFGEIMGDGMTVVDAIAALQRYNFGGALSEIPLRDYQSGDPNETNVVLFSNVQVIDAATDTAANLNPPLNIGPLPEPPPTSGGGGAAGGLLAMLFGVLATRIRRKN